MAQPLSEKEYVVSIDVTEQVSEDSWKVRTRTLKITSKTTMEEIEQWYRKHHPVNLTHLSITELEKP